MKHWIQRIKNYMAFDILFKDDAQGLYIPNRQVSWLLAGIFFLGGALFVTGYFWGHKRALDRFVAKLEEESFADRISYALYTMNDRDSSEFEQDNDQDETNQTTEDHNEAEEESATDQAIEQEETEEANNQSHSDEEKVAVSAEKQELKKIFFAPIAGFGTLQKAEEFVKKVQYIEPHMLIEKKVSKNAKGRMVTWYQAITGEFASREELEKVLQRLRKEAHIKEELKITEKRKG